MLATRDKVQYRLGDSPTAESPDRAEQVILVGNPNVGKSVVFGYLTGTYVTVSNYPGTTVEISGGKARHQGREIEIVDTPGTNSILPNSEDEKVTRDILFKAGQKVVLQVGDAKNLFRTLYLTVQLLETNLPLMLNLNMLDEAKSSGIQIDFRKLEGLLGIPVNGSVAVRKQGLDTLLDRALAGTPGHLSIDYGAEIESAVSRVSSILPDLPISKRAAALMILAGDATLKEWLHEKVPLQQILRIDETMAELSKALGAPVDVSLARIRIRKVNEIIAQVQQNTKTDVSNFARWLGKFTVHPLWGIPVLLFVLYVMYEVVGVLGAGTMVNFLENIVFGNYINPSATWLADKLIPIPLIHDFLVGEYGMITMALSYGFAIILPIVGTFFLMFSFLEDSGYLPRLAVMMNRVFKSMGLNGKAVLPMVLGLGCDTMATLTTRILETKKERLIVTLLLALGVPCSAQLGVILAMTSALSLTASLIWVGIVIGILFLVGYLSNKIMPGSKSDFIIELPPMRVPSIKNILYKTLARMEWYLKEVIPLFILGTAILFVLDKLNVMASLQRLASPVVVDWLGLPKQATEAFLIGFLRRDYGAAGLFQLSRQGLLNGNQILVSIITITLFMPCIANLLIIIKEHKWKVALMMSLFILPFAFFVGGLLNWAFVFMGVQL